MGPWDAWGKLVAFLLCASVTAALMWLLLASLRGAASVLAGLIA